MINPATKRKLEIDLWVPSLKLAIEYDGEQHFSPISFGKMSKSDANKAFNKRKKLDRIKNKLIAAHNKEILYFIRFKYFNPISEQYIVNEFKKLGVLK